MSGVYRRDLTHDLLLPTLLFAALGGMTWAVRGSSGYGAVNGCVFAGVTWGAAWWFIARDPASKQSRRYTSGWIILALTIGIGYSGSRGWMQWPSFWRGELMVDASHNVSVPISRTYGFIWLFIAGVPWAGLGACMLAWCAAGPRLRARDWALRLACGFGVAALATLLFRLHPEYFVPFYKNMQAQYLDSLAHRKTTQYPNLFRLYGDNRLAMTHLGLYLGFLLYEVIRRNWKNVTLISTVGVVNGLGWALLQNWNWAHNFWPTAKFNFWRCWESSGGISIGIAYGIAYFLVNRPSASGIEFQEPEAQGPEPEIPTLYDHLVALKNDERFGLFLGLILGLGYSIKNGLKGWANIYIGNEEFWSGVFSWIMWPLMVACLVLLIRRLRVKPISEGIRGDLFPYAYSVIWFVLIIQNVLAQLITGPLTAWEEVAFNIYYVLLFLITAVIVIHYQYTKTHGWTPTTGE